MKKTLLFFLLLLSATSFAQVHRSAVFDFNTPSSLNPVMTPGSSNGSVVNVLNTVFKSGQIAISFGLPEGVVDNGAQYTTFKDDAGTHYYLQINNRTTMTLSGLEGATLDSLRCPNDNYCTKGALGLVDNTQGYIDVNDPPFTWKNNSGKELSSVSFFNSGGASSKITKMTVYYTAPSDVLVPSSSIANGATVASFEELTLTFDRTMYLQNGSGITLTKGTTTQQLTATVSGNTVKLTPAAAITTDGTYTVTVPAKRFKAGDGYENAALTYTFSVSTPKNTFEPTSVSPAAGNVTSLASPITLTFATPVKSFENSSLILQQNGEDYAPVTATRSSSSSSQVTLSFDIPEGITANGTYTLNIPEGTIYNLMGTIYNPSLTLEYVIGSTTPDPDPDPQPNPDSETMKAAKALLLSTGVGYPSATSASRTALEQLTSATTAPADDLVQAAIDAFYAETDVTLPTAGAYYQIAGVNASGTKAYLTYKSGAVGLSTKQSEATSFEAVNNGTAFAFKTSDGKYLHVLSADDKHDATSTKNVTDAFNAAVNNLSLAKFAVSGVEASKTFGLLSIYGSLGMKNNTSREESAYASIAYGTSLEVTTDPDYALLFSDKESSAFLITDGSAVSTDTLTVETSYTLTVSSDKKLLLLKLDVDGDVTLNENAPATKIATSEGQPIEQANFIKVEGEDYQFKVQLGSTYTTGKFMLLIPKGTFLFTQNGSLAQTDSIAAKFDLGDDTDPDTPTPGTDKTGFSETYSQFIVSPDNTFTVADTDLNNVVISIIYGDYTGLVPDESEQVTITVYDDPSQTVLRTGHFEPYTMPEYPSRPAIRLVLDQPINTGDLRAATYGVKIPAATFGDANFGSYLKDASSVNKKDCKVNPFWAIPFKVNNAAAGIEAISSDHAADANIYDLTGRRVEKMNRPGVYIVNGKKVVKK